MGNWNGAPEALCTCEKG